MKQPAPTARLEARISPSLRSLLKRAAEIQGRTMTEFVVSAVQEAALQTIEKSEIMKLTMADQECFANALLSPPKPAKAMQRAFMRRRKLIKSG